MKEVIASIPNELRKELTKVIPFFTELMSSKAYYKVNFLKTRTKFIQLYMLGYMT